MSLSRLDLGPADVHQDGPAGAVRRAYRRHLGALGTPPPGGSENPGTWASTEIARIRQNKAAIRARETAAAWRRGRACSDGYDGALQPPAGFTHPALTAPRLSGYYAGPPYQDGWVGWVEDAAQSWILFLDVSGAGLLWTKREENGGVIGDPYSVLRPDLLPKIATMRTTTMAKPAKMISASKRKSLPAGKFALPGEKKYPIDTAPRVRNAAARLEQNKGSLSPAKYRKARAAIAAAAKHFGITSQYNRRSADGLSPATATHAGGTPKWGAPPRGTGGFRVHVSSHANGSRRVSVIHASDVSEALTFGMGLPVELVAVCERIVAGERRLRDLPEGEERAALAAEVKKLSDEAAAPRWNQIAKVGRFLGHPAGPFELTPAIFDEIIRNFIEVDGRKVKIDFEHASEAPETEGSIPVTGAPAQGRVLDLQNRQAEGLWGLTEFFEPALTYVREGKYDTFSPAIRFGAKHPETGKPIGARLTSVALVTRPFLRNLQPLAARDGSAPPSTGETNMTLAKLDDKRPHEMMASLKKTMGIHNLATHADMKEHLDKLREHAGGVLDKPHGHAMGHMSAGGVNLGEYVAPMADLLGAPANMSTSDLLDAVEEMIDAAMAIHEVTEHPMGDAGDVLKLGQRLGAAEERNVRLAAERTTLLRDVERLTLEGKAKDAKIVELEAKTVADATELTKLRDAETKRGDDGLNARVEDAFLTYKDTHKLSDAHRPMMLAELRRDAGNFEKLYPLVDATKRHLLRTLAGDRTPAGSTAPVRMGDRQPVTVPGPTPGPAGDTTPMNTAEFQARLCDRLMSERKMSREQATSFAYQVASGQAEMPVFGN